MRLKTVEYYLQSKEQVKWCNTSIVFRPLHFVAKIQQDWDSAVTPFTYVYNVQVYQSTKVAPLSFVLSRHSLRPAFSTTTMIRREVNNIDSTQAINVCLINRAALCRHLAGKNLKVARQRYKSDDDMIIRFKPKYGTGDWVFVKSCLWPPRSPNAWPQKVIQRSSKRFMVRTAYGVSDEITWRSFGKVLTTPSVVSISYV